MRTTASIDSMSEFVASTTSTSGTGTGTLTKKSPDDEAQAVQLLQALNAPKPDLATFLIRRACENTTLVNYFYWYLVIECEDHFLQKKKIVRLVLFEAEARPARGVDFNRSGEA